MHIPDGLIDPKTATGLGLAATTVLAYAAQKVHQTVTQLGLQPAFASIGKKVRSFSAGTKRVLSTEGKEYLSRLSFIAGLIFAAQMFNFPISNGTSGHLLGGVLAAVFLGPWGGSLAVTIVLLVQAFFYADGGIMALGANILNLSVIGCILSYYIYVGLQKVKLPKWIAIGLASWVSEVLAAIACALEIAISGTYDLQGTLQAMFRTHAVIGIGEALITLVLVTVIIKAFHWSFYNN